MCPNCSSTVSPAHSHGAASARSSAVGLNRSRSPSEAESCCRRTALMKLGQQSQILSEDCAEPAKRSWRISFRSGKLDREALGSQKSPRREHPVMKIGVNNVVPASLPLSGLTAAFDAARLEPTAIFVPGGNVPQRGFDEELRRLLRGRLLLIHLLTLALIVLLAAMIRLTPTVEQ